MKTLLALSLHFILCTSVFSQVEYEDEGDNFADINIVATRENFKMSNDDHKELIGLYLEAKPYTRLKLGGKIDRLDVASFEIHIQGDALSSLTLAELQAAAIRYLFVERTAKGTSLHVDSKFINFHYKDYGLYETPDKKIRMLDVAIAETNLGLRYNTAKGSYFVIGAVAGFGFAGKPRGNLEDIGLTMENLAPEADLESDYTEHSRGSNMGAQGGGFVEINFNEKFKLFGSAVWRAKASHDYFPYAVKINTPVPSEDDPEVMVDNITEVKRKVYVASSKFRMDVNVQTDLGRLISPSLTGISLNAGMDWNRYKMGYETVESGKQTPPRTVLMNINQTQFKVGIIVSPSKLFKRRSKSKKYKSMSELY